MQKTRNDTRKQNKSFKKIYSTFLVPLKKNRTKVEVGEKWDVKHRVNLVLIIYTIIHLASFILSY